MLSEEVHNESFSKDTEDSFQKALNSQHLINFTSSRQGSKPSVADTSSSSYDALRGGTNDRSDDNAGNDGV